ncbi:MAG: ATP-binding cassette, subfamily B [Chloroflexi bacterium]|jgi:ATP-binding cassette subfamily B protein|nr:MAG: ATP-binding cassette, subfamily B [Chloroflexota bacterium]
MRHGMREPIKSETALGTMNVRRIAGFLAPYWRRLALILVTVAVAAVLGLGPPLLVRGIIDSAIAGLDRSLLLWLAVGLFSAALAQGLVGVLRSYLNTVVSQRIMYDLKLRMFTRLQSLSLRFYTEARTGELMSRLTSDISGIETIISGTLVTISQNVFILVATLVTMVALDWRLTIVSVIVLPWLIIPTLAVGRVRRRLRTRRQQLSASVNSLMAESLGISGLMLIKTFTREKEVLGRFQRENWDLMNLQIREALVGRWYFMLLFLVTTGGPALIYWFGGGQVISGSLTIGTVIAFVALLGMLYGPAADLMSLHVDVVTSAAYFERIFEYLDLEPDIADAPGAVDMAPAQGAIEFKDVALEYTPGRKALDGLSFALEAGQLAALVGPSGAGKTTITYLIPRLYDPTEGQVLVDGQDLTGVTLESLRSQIGYVSQETFLFHDTVAANLRVARTDATLAEMEEACRAASILEVVERLPESFDTVVGERGYRLSGGEKQRLAIARMLLKNPRILLLDEATSSLDSHSERAVQAALAGLTEGRTTVVIAHRLSTILAADVILYIDNGKVLESGSHSSLMAMNGLYAELYREQFAATAAGAESLA